MNLYSVSSFDKSILVGLVFTFLVLVFGFLLVVGRVLCFVCDFFVCVILYSFCWWGFCASNLCLDLCLCCFSL